MPTLLALEDLDEMDEDNRLDAEIKVYGIRKCCAMILMRKGEKALRQYLSQSEIDMLREAVNGTRL